jgi:hypothetical protein
LKHKTKNNFRFSIILKNQLFVIVAAIYLFK